MQKVAKLVHCNIKPTNIMIRRNHEAALVDFGIQEIIEGSNLKADSLMHFAPELLQLKKEKRAPFSA